MSNPLVVPSAHPLFFVEMHVFKEMRDVGHAFRCVVIHPNRVGVRVKSDRRWSRLKHRFTLKSQVGRVPDGGTRETSEKNLNVTTNLEGGKNSWEQVSSKRLAFGFVLQLSNRFLVFLDSFTLNNARFPPEVPRSHLVDRHCQALGRVGKVAQYEDDYWKELNEEVSHDLLSCV
jgi:hypothetical protein